MDSAQLDRMIEEHDYAANLEGGVWFGQPVEELTDRQFRAFAGWMLTQQSTTVLGSKRRLLKNLLQQALDLL